MGACEQSAAGRFWHDGICATFAQAKWKDPCTRLWKGPDPVLTWG